MSAEAEVNLAANFKPAADYPEFWLGQIKVVSQMEQNGALTRSQMVNEIHRIVKAMDEHGKEQSRRMETILKTK